MQRIRQIIQLSATDKHRLKMLADYKQTSMAQLVREAIRYAFLHLWIERKQDE